MEKIEIDLWLIALTVLIIFTSNHPVLEIDLIDALIEHYHTEIK